MQLFFFKSECSMVVLAVPVILSALGIRYFHLLHNCCS